MKDMQSIIQKRIDNYKKQQDAEQRKLDEALLLVAKHKNNVHEFNIRISELEQCLASTTTGTTVRLKPRKKRPTSNNPSEVIVPNTGITITDAMIDHEKTKKLQNQIDIEHPGARPNPNAYLLCLTNNTAWTSFSTLATSIGKSSSFFYNTAKQNNGKVTSHDYDFQWFIPNTKLPIQEDGEHYDSVDDYATAKGEDVDTVIHALLCGSKKFDIQPA